MKHLPSLKPPPIGSLVKRVLLYSQFKHSLDDYAKTLSIIGDTFDIVDDIAKAKRLLETLEYHSLIADVTNFDSNGRKLITWVKIHFGASIKTHGYMRTDMPSLAKKVYNLCIDQRFSCTHTDIDHLTEVLFSVFLNHPDLSWVRDMTVGQKRLRELIGNQPSMSRPVLLQGPKGSGKEALTLLVHSLCNRFEFKFIVLDCNPRQRFDYIYRENKDCRANRQFLRDHFESLFGEANHGTIFFRSFTHLSIMAQEVLVEVLENGRCRNHNTGKLVRFDGRIVFSTNKSLPLLLKNGKLSARLYSLLEPTSLILHPLTHYKDELPLMAQAISDYHCSKLRGKDMRFLPGASQLILNHPWTGNIEEMNQTLQSALITAKNRVIAISDLMLIHPVTESYPAIPDNKGDLENQLDIHNGCVQKVADHYGISRSKMYRLMTKLGVSRSYGRQPKDTTKSIVS